MTISQTITQNPLLVASLAILVLVFAYTRAPKRGRLPPGPRGWPVIGSAFEIPGEFEWLTFQRWSRDFGSDLLYYTSWGRPHVLINSNEVASDLLEKRSAIYSDRPRMPMLNELVGFGWDFAFMPYADGWKATRKAFTQHFRPAVVPEYRDIETQQARTLVLDILETPDKFDALARGFAGKIIIPIVYGIDVQKHDDPYVGTAQKALHAMNMTGNVGTYLVDHIPALKYLPEWFPGARFQREAREWRGYAQAMLDKPTEAVKRAVAAGTARPSMMTSLLSSLKDGDAHAEWIRSSAAATAYEGGSETVYSVVSSFILAMLMHPDIQRKAREEVDRVVGRDRLPEFADQAAMPYLMAVYKEVLRYEPVLPLAIMRRVSEDDTYQGYHIPRGTTVVVNSWAMLHDERVYPDPGTFKPERFLNENGELDANAPEPTPAFGFGRRICPGMYIAADAVWIAFATLLWAFEIEKPVDEAGRVVEPTGEYTFGLVCYPAPFQCTFKPRIEKLAEAIHVLV